MLISCKCLNFVINAQNSNLATVINQQGTTTNTSIATNISSVNDDNSEREQQQQQQHLQHLQNKLLQQIHQQNDDKNGFSRIETDLKIISELYGINIDEFKRLQQKSSNHIYEKCLEFFRQSTGPLNNLQENIVQKDLVYKVPIKPWILYCCINCDTITYAKHTSNNMIYIIDTTLLKNQDELNCLKQHQTYSETFGILIMDCPKLKYFMKDNNNMMMMDTTGAMTTTTSSSVSSILPHQQLTSIRSSLSGSGSSASTSLLLINREKQIRLKNLTDILNNRLQKEIYDTDERIRRYTEQQFALLKSFREKSEQEYQILVSQINYVPDELKINNDAIDNNTIIMNNDTTNNDIDNNINGINGTIKSNTTITETDQSKLTAATEGGNVSSSSSSSTSLFTLKQQQILNLDTPPATPDSTPMSVGNSPTFRQQQQQQQQQFGDVGGGGGGVVIATELINNQKSNLIDNSGGYNDYNAMIISNDTDCQFELEGMETVSDSTMTRMNTTDMSDLEDAEDALGDLESTAVQIPRSNSKKSNENIAKSLPISILNVPERKFYINDLDDEIPEDSNIDIAASIKALAKSVHGDTVFGDLPRPRFSTQI